MTNTTQQYFQQAASAALAHEQLIANLVAEGWQYDDQTGVFSHPGHPGVLICEG